MTIDTLPSWLNHQASTHGYRVAIRHKQLGIWGESNWENAKNEVFRLVQLLKGKGFSVGDTVYLLTHPRPEALLLSIAAQWLGGVAAPIDPKEDVNKIIQLFEKIKPSFLFAEAQAQVDLALQLNQRPRLIVYADQRGLSNYAIEELQYYRDTQNADLDIFDTRSIAEPEHTAFAFFRLEQEEHFEVQLLTHREMLMQGRELVSHEKLTRDEEALAARSFAASGHVRYLLAPWLLTGFRLNFPENIDTRDNDRRELGPTLVAGTKETYERLEVLINSRLPLEGTRLRKAFNWALNTQTKKSWFNKAFAQWLFLFPLRDVIGFSRTRVPLVVDEPLGEKTLKFFAALGVNIRIWPDIRNWTIVDTHSKLNTLTRASKKNQPVSASELTVTAKSTGVFA